MSIIYAEEDPTHSLMSYSSNVIKDRFNLNEKQIESLSYIEEQVRSFTELCGGDDFGFELTAAGGCVRDSLCLEDPQMKIKDIDLLFSPKSIPRSFDISNGVSQAGSVPIKYTQKIEQMIEKLSKVFKYVKKAEAPAEEYSSPYIEAVIKIYDPCLRYSIDLICVKHMENAEFIDFCYDFELCKVQLSKDNSKDVGHYVEFSSGFENDFKNKKITFSNTSFDENEVLYSLDNHYKRLKVKYPDFTLDYNNANPFPDNVKTLLDYHIIKEKIPHKNKSISSIKI